MNFLGTLEYIPWDHINRMKQLQKLMNPKRNYSHYRKQLRFTSTSSTVPYLGVYMRDLTFLKDGNPDFLKRDILNLFKIVKVINVCLYKLKQVFLLLLLLLFYRDFCCCYCC